MNGYIKDNGDITISVDKEELSQAFESYDNFKKFEYKLEDLIDYINAAKFNRFIIECIKEL